MGPYFETYKRHFGVDDKDQKKSFRSNNEE